MAPVITFPHAGDYDVAFEYFFRKVGFQVVLAEKRSQRSLDLGIRHAPPQACIPFKYTLGDLIQGAELGANTFAMIGGKTGICRLKYYGELYRKILKDLGYDLEFFPFKLKRELWTELKRRFPAFRFSELTRYFSGLILKMNLVELARDLALGLRPFETEPGACSRLYRRFVDETQNEDNFARLWQLRRKVQSEFGKLPVDKARSFVRIGLVGEFFLLIDQFSSLNTEALLGQMGAVVEPSLNFSEFLVGSIKQVRFFDRFFPTVRHRVARYAAPFINRPIGGHARESIGQAVRFAHAGYDGVIHLYPFTCMPEMVACSLLPCVSAEMNIPVLSLCLDEQSGEAGLQTRLEAFVDMLIRRKYRSSEQKPGFEISRVTKLDLACGVAGGACSPGCSASGHRNEGVLALSCGANP